MKLKRSILAGISMLVLSSVFIVSTRSVQAAVDNTPDCDTVAIIRCGAFTESGLQNKAKDGDIPRVYNAFGINQNELKGFVEGVVWKDGRVTVGNDKVVARNAVTAGRWNNPTGDMTKIPNTDRAYKMSTSHFVDDGQVAFIKMVNGKFAFAVIKTCGNPVTATPVDKPEPQPKPALTINKEVKLPGNSNWQEAVGVKPGDQVKYRVVITNTGNVTLDKLSILDMLPEGITQVMVPGGMELNGVGIGNYLSGSGMTLPTLKPGEKHVLIYTAASSVTETRADACKKGLINKAIVRSGGVVPDRSDSATVKVCADAVSYSCSYMNLKLIDKESRTVETDTAYTAENATFKHFVYDFGDGSAPLVSADKAVRHSYAQDGTYTAKVQVVFTANGTEVTALSNETCVKSITFQKDETPIVEPPKPKPEQPETLVDTGTGAMIGAVLSTISGGAVAYRYVWLRRYL